MLTTLILSGALIGVPAKIIDVFPDRNELRVEYILPQHTLRFNVESSCPLWQILKGTNYVSFVTLRAQDGKLHGAPSDCPV